jgi:hypothetical protein
MKIKTDSLKQDLFRLPHCYFAPDIPKRKLDNVMIIHAIEANEKVLLLKDISVTGSGKNGWVLTDKNIYFNHVKNKFSIEHSKIKSVFQIGGSIIINDKPKAFVGTKSDAKKLAKGIQNLLGNDKTISNSDYTSLKQNKKLNKNERTVSDSIKRIKKFTIIMVALAIFIGIFLVCIEHVI